MQKRLHRCRSRRPNSRRVDDAEHCSYPRNSAIVSGTQLCRARPKAKQLTSAGNKVTLVILLLLFLLGREGKGRVRFLITGPVLIITVILMGTCKALDIGRRDVRLASRG